MNAAISGTARKKVRVGIIGFGRFGELTSRILKRKFKDVRVLVFSRKREKPGVEGGIEFASLDEVCNCDVIIPCVPISGFEGVIKSICGKIKPGALLVDVCSVKVYPVEVMMKYIPENVEILATHPAFGPDSARRGLKGLKVILHNVRISPEKFARVKQACRDIGLEVIEMTPEEHDRLMAFSLAYTHLVGRIGQRMNVKTTPVDTKGFAQLLKVQGYVVNDTLELFRDMQNYNPYVKEMRKQFRKALTEIEAELASA
jgi:prephenate dehydrogenase